MVADGGHALGGSLKGGIGAYLRGLFEKIGVEIAKARAAGADFFLHAHQVAEIEFGVVFGAAAERGDAFGNGADAAHADEKYRRQHMFGVFADGAA